jgi:hypothetical protein
VDRSHQTAPYVPVAQWQEASRLEREQCQFESDPAHQSAHVAQSVGGAALKARTVLVRVQPWAPNCGCAQTGKAAGLKPRWLVVRTHSSAPIRSHSLAAKAAPLHGAIRGSSPRGSTNSRAFISVVESLLDMQDVRSSNLRRRTKTEMELTMRQLFAIQREDGKVWSHNGKKLGERTWYWLDEWVLWTDSIGHPATWWTRRAAEMARKSLQGKVIEYSGE